MKDKYKKYIDSHYGSAFFNETEKEICSLERYSFSEDTTLKNFFKEIGLTDLVGGRKKYLVDTYENNIKKNRFGLLSRAMFKSKNKKLWDYITVSIHRNLQGCCCTIVRIKSKED